MPLTNGCFHYQTLNRASIIEKSRSGLYCSNIGIIDPG